MNDPHAPAPAEDPGPQPAEGRYLWITDTTTPVDELRRRLAEYDAQAVRLVAVGDALMYAISIVCNIENPTVTQNEPWEPLRRRFLDQAHAALGPPSTEMAPRQEAPRC